MILCDILWRLPQVFDSYNRRSKFDSVLHIENDDVLYGFSAINVELNGVSMSISPRLICIFFSQFFLLDS